MSNIPTGVLAPWQLTALIEWATMALELGCYHDGVSDRRALTNDQYEYLDRELDKMQSSYGRTYTLPADWATLGAK